MKIKFVFLAILMIFALLFSTCEFLSDNDNNNNNENNNNGNGPITGDTAYDEIIALAKRLCDELEYDWSTRDDYTGAIPKQTPGKRHRQCNGYAIEMMEKAIMIESVKTVQHWRATKDTGAPGNHSWNIIKLIDGRILFCDLTAFATNRINTETGEVYHAADYRWEKITFDEEEFKTKSPNTSYYPHGMLLEEARAPGFMSGVGTAENPFVITKAEQLAAISLWVRAMDSALMETYNAAHYKLGNNIDLSEYAPTTSLAWKPIGTPSRSFLGVFDGNSKVISGLTISPTSTYDWGLFGYVRGSKIKNLGIEIIVINGISQIGGIAGTLSESAVISNCYTTGEITASGVNIGGIAGWIREGSIVENCYSTVDIKGSGSRVGGLVGNINGTESTVRNSAALNPSVVGNTNVARVYGLWSAGTTRPNNIAFSDMLSGTTDFNNKTLTGSGGLDFSASQIRADGTLGGRFTAVNGWTVENGKLPGFGASRILPDYIR